MSEQRQSIGAATSGESSPGTLVAVGLMVIAAKDESAARRSPTTRARRPRRVSPDAIKSADTVVLACGSTTSER